MRISNIHKLVMLGAYICFVPPVCANSPIVYDEDWTVQVQGDSYGLRGHGRYTRVLCGSRDFWIPIPIYGVVGCTVALFAGITFFSGRAIARKNRDTNTPDTKRCS